MADRFTDGVFWLPTDFLDDDDDDLFRESEPEIKGTRPGCARVPFAGEIRNGLGSDLNLPTDIWTEMERGKEDYLSGFSRQMAHSFLDDEEDAVAFPGSNPKVMAGSPQSTLCALEGWSGSSSGSPNGPSQVSSPPRTPSAQSGFASDDLLNLAVGQVMRMRLEEQEKQIRHQGRAILATPKKPSPSLASASKLQAADYYENPMFIPPLQQLEFERLKREQLIKQQLSAAWAKHDRSRGSRGHMNRGCVRPLGLPSSAWPPLQPQQQQQPHPGCGMRAIFLDASRKASTGTGVFLPRRSGNKTETNKKPGCSTVLLPARVVQTLNLNLDELNANSRFSGRYVVDHGGLAGNAVQAKRSHHHPLSATAAMHNTCLPAEWTY